MRGAPLLLTAGQVLLGPRDEVIEDGAVLVDGARIAAVGPRAEVEALAPGGIARTDRSDGTLLPGLIGTDAGLGPFDDSPGAVARWAQWGFDAAEMIIEMVTSGAAGHLGLAEVTGRLAPGLAADVLLVRGDPLTDLAALAEIDLVLTRGTTARGAGRPSV